MQVFESKEGQTSGELQVVDAYAVQQLSLAGWNLVFAYQEECIQPVMETIPNTNPNPNFGYSPTIQTSRQEKVVQTRFVMRRDEASALAAMEARAVVAETSATKLKTEFDGASKKCESAEKELQRETNRNQSLSRTLSDSSRDLQQSEETRRKLEGDIGKIRVAIGSKQMDEIVSTKKEG